jgi:hypothetical protein
MLKLRAKEIPLHAIKEFHGTQGSHTYLLPSAGEADLEQAMQYLQIDPSTTCGESIEQVRKLALTPGRVSVLKLWKEPS